MTTVDAFWLPPSCPIQLETRTGTVERGGRRLHVRWPVVTPTTIRDLCAWLAQRQRKVLLERSVDSIATTLDRVAGAWLQADEPLRQQAVEAIATVAGFSEPMVAHAIELEQVSSRKADMIRALDSELGDHRALDGFVDHPTGRTTAVGPSVIGGVFSANIPALPHLTVMRSLLVKAACLGRVSRGEPVYLPLYVQSIARLDPELASCLAVLWWDSSDEAVQDAFYAGIDHLIAYGSDASLSSLAARLPSRVRATWHGHRMGFAYIGRAALTVAGLDALADRIAYDFSVFDQHACLAPQACFVERGGEVSPAHFAERVSARMAHWLGRLPPRSLSVGEAAQLRGALDEAVLREAMGAGTTVLSPPRRLQGVVVLSELAELVPSPLDRFARIVGVEGPYALEAALAPVARWLQCAAVAGVGDDVRRALARMGVTRLCPPGAMGTPSMAWHHDGRPCLGDLVRWCDEETVPPGA